MSDGASSADQSRKWQLTKLAFARATEMCLLWFAAATALLGLGKIDAPIWQSVAVSVLQTWAAVEAGLVAIYGGANVVQKFSPGQQRIAAPQPGGDP